MQHVADDADLDSLKSLEMIAQCEQIEQCLGRMLVCPIARVDHIRLDAIGEKLRGTGRAMADHDHVDAHGLEIPRGINECFALLYARSCRGDVHCIGGETLFSELEGDTRTSGRLEEE